MKVSADWSALRGTQWHQYALRFALGGFITAAAGAIATYQGPIVGGLFLAFPALFPAGATLIEKRESRRKESHGLDGTLRGRRVAALDAAGTVLGAVALSVFACLVWAESSRLPLLLVLFIATGCWLAAATSLWWLRKKHIPRLRRIPTDLSG